MCVFVDIGVGRGGGIQEPCRKQETHGGIEDWVGVGWAGIMSDIL